MFSVFCCGAVSPLRGDAAFGLLPGCASGRAVTFLCFPQGKSPKEGGPTSPVGPGLTALRCSVEPGSPQTRPRTGSNMWTSLSGSPCAARRLGWGPSARVVRCANLPSPSPRPSPASGRGRGRNLGDAQRAGGSSPVCRAEAGLASAETEKKLFELRWPQAKRASSFFPAGASPASVQPAAKRRARQSGLLCAHLTSLREVSAPAFGTLPTFFGEAKKVGAPPGAHPGNRPKAASARRGDTARRSR